MVKVVKVIIKPDLRREISSWGLLIWAYRDQSVRAASYDEKARYCSNGLVLQRLGETGIGRGAINGYHLPHEDALAIDAFVEEWFEPVSGGRDYLAWYAERAKLPPHPDTLPRERLVPLLKHNGMPETLIHPVTRRPYACILKMEGLSKREIDRQATLYALWDVLLDIMIGKSWSNWKVTQRGLTSCDESLTRVSMLSALRPVDE